LVNGIIEEFQRSVSFLPTEQCIKFVIIISWAFKKEKLSPSKKKNKGKIVGEIRFFYFFVLMKSINSLV